MIDYMLHGFYRDKRFGCRAAKCRPIPLAFSTFLEKKSARWKQSNRWESVERAWRWLCTWCESLHPFDQWLQVRTWDYSRHYHCSIKKFLTCKYLQIDISGSSAYSITLHMNGVRGRGCDDYLFHFMHRVSSETTDLWKQLWNLFLLSTELNLLPLLVVCILVAVGKEFLQFLAALRHKQGAEL